MSFLKGLFNGSSITRRLTDDWFSDLSDETTANEIGDKGDRIITDQPSYPKKEETEFYFDDNDRLILKFGGGILVLLDNAYSV